MYAHEANGKPFKSAGSGVSAIGSYWCPAAHGSTYSGDQNTCNIYGALYAWETAMMVDGKYADESKTSSAWDVSWLSFYRKGAPASTPEADRNNARGGTNVKGGGRGICPKGWHVPTVREWTVMLDSVEHNTIFSQSDTCPTCWRGTVAGLHLKSIDTHSAPCGQIMDGTWCKSNYISTDQFNFCALPAGERTYLPPTYIKSGEEAGLLTSGCSHPTGFWALRLTRNSPGIRILVHSPCLGMNVRCIQD